MPAWSGLWNGVYGENYSQVGKPNPGRRFSRAMRGMTALKFKEIVRTFVTDDVGTTALATHKRVASHDYTNAGSLGGVRLTETITDINRALTADDETEVLGYVDGVHTPTFPTEKSGNSGGGKLGF